MAINIGYKQFPEFDIRKDPETVYARFVKYAERFKNNHLKAYNITDKAQQRSLFLDSIGEATLDIFEQLSNTGTDLDGAVNALRDKFKESQNRLYNIHKFRCIKQGKDETWDSFISKLKAEGEHCDFPAGWLDTEILMAMVESGKSKRVRRKLLQDQLTLAEALKYARGLESADQHATKVENETPTDVTVKQEVDKITVDRKEKKSCFNCGKQWPHQGGPRKCPAFGKQCTRCGKRNHFANYCKSKQEIKATKELAYGGEQKSDTSSESSDESTCTLETVNPMGTSEKRPLKKVLINGASVTVLPDSGATVSAMDEATLRRYGLEDKVKIKKSRCQIKPYGAVKETNLIPVLGSFEALTESKTKMKVVTWQLIKGDTQTAPLLSYEDGKDLGMIHVSNAISKETKQSEDTSHVKELVEEYKDRFEGIGKLTDIQVDLNVDPDFKPVAQPPRRQPFSVREKMEKEIQHLLDQDIIEKVNEPTGWVSPPVVTPKKDQSQIRLNVDMRVANQAIPRRHTQHPTIDDVITELSGSTVFSHLDMSKGYHQLELKESSRNVTTFSTHIGLYRYKRLNYGTRSAAEIFQETIREELTQDLKGVFNISDDIIVHGRDTKEHDTNLEALLKKSREKNITFNKTKCEFNKERVVYYGLMFSKEGVSPDPCNCTKEQVQKATDEDPTLLALRGCIHQGWIDPKAENLQVYKQVFSELAVVDGMVVRGDRIVVPETLKQRMIEIVFHCQYSRYPVVEFVGSTSEKVTIPVFRRVFDTYGVPEAVKSDNGPPFNSHKFEEYAREEGFKHQKVTPGWPEANGDVERCMQRIKKTARIAALQGRPIRDEVRRGTRAYRTTVHPTTGASPNKLMFGRELRGKLPEARRQAEHPDDATVRKRDREQKEKMKKYADKRRHTAAMRIKVGDTVLCKQEKKNSLTPLFDPVPMVVIGIKGDMITAKNNQRIRTRNYADWKLLKDGCRHSATCDESDDEDAFDPDEVVVDEHQQGAEQPKDTDDMEQRWAIRDRPRRKITSTKDSKYKDFICD